MATKHGPKSDSKDRSVTSPTGPLAPCPKIVPLHLPLDRCALPSLAARPGGAKWRPRLITRDPVLPRTSGGGPLIVTAPPPRRMLEKDRKAPDDHPARLWQRRTLAANPAGSSYPIPQNFAPIALPNKRPNGAQGSSPGVLDEDDEAFAVQRACQKPPHR